jgi:hypothetical protein
MTLPQTIDMRIIVTSEKHLVGRVAIGTNQKIGIGMTKVRIASVIVVFKMNEIWVLVDLGMVQSVIEIPKDLLVLTGNGICKRIWSLMTRIIALNRRGSRNTCRTKWREYNRTMTNLLRCNTWIPRPPQNHPNGIDKKWKVCYAMILLVLIHRTVRARHRQNLISIKKERNYASDL